MPMQFIHLTFEEGHSFTARELLNEHLVEEAVPDESRD